MARVECTCRTCGAVFGRTPSAIVLGGGKYCSHACQGVGQRSAVRLSCLRCGTPIVVAPAKRAKGGGKYCSLACKRTRVDRVCLRCGRAFTAPLNRIAAGFGVYCSRRCGRMTHGESHDVVTPEYRAWSSMKTRCLNPRVPNFKAYGGRGITVCERWRDSYQAFLADVGRRPSPAHSLHRIDNDRGYEVGNVVWALPTEQIPNKRSTRLLTFRGITQPLGAWATAVGLKPETLGSRLYRAGWSVERALTTPPRTKR